MAKPRYLDIPLDSIQIAASEAEVRRWIPADSCLAAATRFTPEAVRHLLLAHPICVTLADEGQYIIRAGHRSLQLARAVLDPGALVPAVSLDSGYDVDSLAYLDDLLSPVLLGPGSEDLSILRWLDAREAGMLDGGLAQQMGFQKSPSLFELADFLGISHSKMDRMKAKHRTRRQE